MKTGQCFFVSSFSNVGKRAKILTLLVSSSQLQHSQSEVVRQGETGSAGNNPIFSPDEWSVEFAFSYKAFTAILTPYKSRKGNLLLKMKSCFPI